MPLTEPPKLFPFATPEEVKGASEKMVHMWVGALSPMWVPFWAATSFGIGAWTVAQSLGRSGELTCDLPKVPGFANAWPGFVTPPKAVAETVEDVVDTVTDTVAETSAEMVEAAEPAVLIDPVTEVPVVTEVVEAMADLPAPSEVIEAIAESSTPDVSATVEDVTPAVIKATPPKTAAKSVAPKAIAEELAVAKLPKATASKAAAPKRTAKSPKPKA